MLIISRIQNIKDKKVYSEDTGLESSEGLEGSEGSHGVAQKDRAISWFRWMDSSRWFRQMTIQMVQESRCSDLLWISETGQMVQMDESDGSEVQMFQMISSDFQRSGVSRKSRKSWKSWKSLKAELESDMKRPLRRYIQVKY